MALPSPWLSPFASMLYILLAYILVMGFYQHYRMEKIRVYLFRKSLIPVGLIAVCLALWGVVSQINQTFEAIQTASDISPALVAGGITQAYPHLSLGLLCLILSLTFYYFNSKKRKEAMTPPLT